MSKPKTDSVGRIKNLSPVLMKILPVMFRDIGLTMTDVRPYAGADQFGFRIKEFDHRISLDYDGFTLELIVEHYGTCMDLIPFAGVPLVVKKGVKYFACWLGSEKKLHGPHLSIETLLKRYLSRQLKKWKARDVLPETKIGVYRTMSRGCTWARIINRNHPPMKKQSKYLLKEIPLLTAVAKGSR